MTASTHAIPLQDAEPVGRMGLLPRRRAPILVAVLLNLFVGALCAGLLWQSRLGELKDARARVVNLSRLAELNVSATLDKAGIALTSTATQIERQLTPQGIDARVLWDIVDAENAQVPEILRIGVFDAQGRQVCAPQAARCQNLDVSQRDYFQQLKANPGMPMRLFGPYLNKVDNQSALVLVRALRRPEGSFVGVTGAIIPVSGLQALMAVVDVGSSGRAALRREDLHPLAPPPGPPRSADELAKLNRISNELLAAVSANPAEGAYRALSGFDDVDRQTAYRHLPKYPLYVIVGLATTEFLEPWRQTAAWTGVFLLMFAATSFVVVRLIHTGMKRQQTVRALLTQVTESEDRLRSLYETTPAMLHAIDLDGHVTMVSDSWLDKLGYARSDVLGRRSVEFLTEASRGRVLSEGLPMLMDKGWHDDMELQMITRTGEVIDVLRSAKLERSEDGTPLRITVGLQDVTQRRRAERALDEERQRLQNIILGTGAGTWQHHLITGEDVVNDNYVAMLGYSMEAFGQAANVSFMDLVHPADRDGVCRARQAHLDGATAAYESEFRMQHRDGHWIWIFSRGSVFLRDPKGLAVAISGIHLDITRRKEAERQLNRERKQLANILEGTNVGTWEWNVETGDCKFNERWADMGGYALEELGAATIGTWTRLTHPDDLTASSVLLERHFNGELPYYEAEVRVRHKNGDWVWVLDRGKLFSRSEDGRPRWMAGTRLDITKRKLAEQAHRDYSERFDLAAESAGIGVWEFDPVTGHVQWDDRMFRLYGSPRRDGQQAKDLWFASVHADDLPGLKAALQQTIKGSRSEAEFRIVWPGGEIRHLRAHAQAVPDSMGRTVRVIGVNFDITDRCLAEDRLRSSKAFLDSAGRVAGVGGWMLDLVTGEIEWTDETCRIHEVPAGFKPALDQAINFYAPEARPVVQQAVEHAVATGEGWDLELALVTAEGRSIWVRAIGEVETEGGKPARLVGAFQDVTARRALEAELRTKNQVMSSVLESLPCGLSVFDNNLELVASNAEYRRLLAFPDALFEAAAPRFEDFIRYNAVRGEYGPGEVESTVQAIVARARERTVPHTFERARPDGTPLEIRGGPMPGGGFVTTYTDISARQRAEAEVERVSALLRGSIDVLDDAYSLFDPDDRMVLCNQRYRDLYPLAAEFMVPGNTFEQIMRGGAARGQYAAAAGREEAWVQERMAVHRQPASELQTRLADGRTMRIVERRMPDGHTVGFRVDITEFIRATEAAQEASRSKSQFLANMSHEIRTPMNAILGMLALLKKTELTARQADYTGKTEGAARSLLGLLNDILDFSKVEAGKMTLDLHPFRPDQLLRDLAVILAANTTGKQIEVLFDIDPQLPPVLVGDAMRLQQVLINLGGNAIKFTAQGEVVVSVRVAARSSEAVTLEVAVRDSGIGIAPENQRHIFSGFSQAEASTTRRFGGTGLGLAICQRLVGLMGSELQLDSVVGRGSSFHFRIELAVGSDAAGAELAPLRLRQPVALRVLVVDDNLLARELMQRMAESLGWQVTQADSGEAALACLEGDDATFDAAFIDWQMPGLDGWQTCQQIRGRCKAGATPLLIMVTAHGRDMLSQRSQEEQAIVHGFLVKPVTASMLYDAVVDARSDPEALQASRTGSSPAVQRLPGLRLLVVEDNANNQQVARELLEDEGADVQIAENGLLAVEAVAAADPPFDVVLMDLQMPVMDGYTATTRIRQDLQKLTLPIVAMTANAMATDREACLAAGMNDHVGKPFDLDHLISVLLRLAGRSAVAATAPRDQEAAPALPAAVLAAADVSGVDIERALARLGGKLKVYGRTLRSFTADLQGLPQKLDSQLQRGERDEVRRELHTLKGVAATVGVMALAKLAGDAETQFASVAPAAEEAACVARIGAAIHRAALLLARLCAALDDDLKPTLDVAAPAVAAALTLADTALLAGLLRTVQGLLQASDLDAADALQNLRTRLPAVAGARFDALEAAVESLEFEAALSHCGEWLLECET